MSKKSLTFSFWMILFALLIAGCGGAAPGGTYVWIDVPTDGLSFAELQPVLVKGHAAGDEGVSRIELFVDGEPWIAVEDPEIVDDLAWFEAEWLPPEEGTFTIHAVAYGAGDTASPADEIEISFGQNTPTPVITVTPVISITPTLTDTPTPLPEPETSVAFWADQETIDAGMCTDIHWQAENVKSLVFGGVEQENEGVFQVCLCKNETYTLTVTHQDDSEEKYKVNINVVGTCADTTPPPAPVPAVPANGLSLSCRSTQDLVWQPVSDASGISEYQLRVQRHSGDNNWTDIPGSVFTGIPSKQKNISVSCGWYYRWQVRAVDGEANVGPWSNWWKFTINLE